MPSGAWSQWAGKGLHLGCVMENRVWAGIVATIALASVLAGAAFADGDGTDVEDIGPTDEMVTDHASSEGRIEDGDESNAREMLVYLDGCPLFRLTPVLDEDGTSTTTRVTTVKQSGTCTPIVTPPPCGAGVLLHDGALHVRVWKHTGAKPQDGQDGSEEQIRRLASDLSDTMIVDVSSLEPTRTGSDACRDTQVAANDPTFVVPPFEGGPNGVSFPEGGGGGGNGDTIEVVRGLPLPPGNSRNALTDPKTTNTPAPVPLPASILMLAAGVAALGGAARIRHHIRNA